MPQGADPKSSGTVHNAMRYRTAIKHDPAVIEAMARKAALVDEAAAALRPGHRERLSPIVDRDFDLCRSVYDLPASQVRMIDIARRDGPHAKFVGSVEAVRPAATVAPRTSPAPCSRLLLAMLHTVPPASRCIVSPKRVAGNRRTRRVDASVVRRAVRAP